MWTRAQQFFKKHGIKCAAAGAPLFLFSSTAYALGGTGVRASHRELSGHGENQSMMGHYPWNHIGKLDGFDHASLRRGYQVYKEVCAACHSATQMRYRHLVGVTHTEEQVKAEAAAITVTEYDYVPYKKDTEPDDKGNPWQREGRITDPFPSPYPNENAARAANNGAVPPDFSQLALARPGGIDYIFALLTGYDKPVPAGVTVDQGKYWNPWFPGGIIGMAPPLMDGSVEYEDGTPATTSQMAKDVCVFLHWISEPYYEDAKMMAIPAGLSLMLAAYCAAYYKRQFWTPIRAQKINWKLPSQNPRG